LVKTDVILFGESLPTGVIQDAIVAAKGCDLLIMVGSSLLVSPANLLPAMAKANGAKIIFINKDPTPMDHLADVVLFGKAGEILPTVIKRIKNNM